MIRRMSDADIMNIIQIHKNNLPWSVLSVYGWDFLEIYYTHLLSNNAFFCNIFEINKKPVGFITFTTDSARIISKIIKEDFIKFATILITSVIKEPSRLSTIISSMNFVLFSQGNILPNIRAEVIAFAVSPKYRKTIGSAKNNADTEFYRKTKKNIAYLLMKSALIDLKKMGYLEFKVQTEGKNAAANKFYSRIGCKLSNNKPFFRGQRLHIYTGNIESVLERLKIQTN